MITPSDNDLTAPSAHHAQGRRPGHWWNGPKMVSKRRAWWARTARLTTVEVGLAGLILVLWAVLGTWGAPLLTLFALILGLWLHLAAAESGGHVLMWMATGFVLGCMVLTAGVLLAGAGPVSLAVGSFTALVYNELLRLHHARRRNARIDEDVYVGSALGMGVLGLLSLVGVSLADRFDDEGSRSWLWMAAAIAILMLTATLVTAIPRRRFPKGTSQRWQPGDRIPPQPLGQLESD